MREFFFVLSIAHCIQETATASLRASDSAADSIYSHQKDNQWFKDGLAKLQATLKVEPIDKRAKGVVLFIGDGMGPSTVTAARILDGQMKGKSGEEHVLSWEDFPYVGLSKTYNTDQMVPDSAGTATAFMTGVKTRAGMIAVDEEVVRGDCSNIPGHEVLSIIMLAESRGLSTGVVTTTKVTHATPATAYAHAASRSWEASASMDGCADIAIQAVRSPYGDGLEVLMGGGRQNFVPRNTLDPESREPGKRNDSQDLIQMWKDKSTAGSKFEYVWNLAELRKLDPNKVDHIMGLFEGDHMNYEYERLNDTAGEPSLTEMVEFAVKVLQKNPKGFVLLVEGGRIDHGHHANKAVKALTEAVQLAAAVEKVKSITNQDEVLLVVSADHSHVFTMGGYPSRGREIFGTVDNYSPAVDGKEFSILGYYNGPSGLLNESRADAKDMDLTSPDTYYQSLVKLRSETHGGEDVGIYARGPQAHLIGGVVEQNYIFHLMDYALCLSPSKREICEARGLLNESVPLTTPTPVNGAPVKSLSTVCMIVLVICHVSVFIADLLYIL